MLSDAMADGRAKIDYYLTHPEWKDDYSPEMRARATVISSAMDAIRGYLDTLPEASAAIDVLIATGDTTALDQQIAIMAEQWRASSPPNLQFSPSTFRAWAVAAATILRAIDQHLVPLLPELAPMTPQPEDGDDTPPTMNLDDYDDPFNRPPGWKPPRKPFI